MFQSRYLWSGAWYSAGPVSISTNFVNVSQSEEREIVNCRKDYNQKKSPENSLKSFYQIQPQANYNATLAYLVEK